MQNGLAKCKHRHPLETVISLQQTVKLPPKFWFHACDGSVPNEVNICSLQIKKIVT